MELIVIILSLTGLCSSCNYTFEEEDSTINDKGIKFDEISKPDIFRNKFHYSLMPESSVLSISQEGILHFKRSTDREWLCTLQDLSLTCPCKEAVCKISVGIWIQDRSIKETTPPLRYQVEICIKDKNDNCPKLPSAIHKSMIESTKLGFTIPLQAATDNDSNVFSKSTYKLKCNRESSKFKLTIFENIPNIELIAPLDHETTSSHTCHLEACEVRCCSTATVTISVTDDNDHSPTWTVGSWQISIPENSPPNTQIMQLSASDLDSTYNQLLYSIEGNRQDLFQVEAGSGIIRLASYIDYETLNEKTIHLIVKVADNGIYQPKSATGTVTISVLDVNDNRPIINIKNNIYSIEENSRQVYLGYMTVSDADSGINGMVSCEVVHPEDKIQLKQPMKVSSPNTVYDIYSSSSFDHEVSSRVSVKIVCSDKGQPKQSSEVELMLQIKDVDDNNVKFIKKLFAAGIDEEKEIGTYITQIEAIDKDSTSNLEYFLLNKTDLKLVEIDRFTGVIRSNKVFDREIKDEYKIEVGVREKLSINKTDFASVLIKILDINDNDPKFEQLYSFSVSEKTEINIEIGNVTAKDPDLKNNGTIVYTQQKLDDNPFLFFVDQIGKIRLFQKLDYETQPLHHIHIIATDMGYPTQRTSTTTVIVTVIDENDNPPKFKHRYFEVDIGCHTRFLSRDLIPVSDNDTDNKNRQMQFYLQPMINPPLLAKQFRIDNHTGEITIEFDQQSGIFCDKLPKKIELKVGVFDPTFPEFKDHCILRLKLSQPHIKQISPDQQVQDSKGKFKEKINNEKEIIPLNNNSFDSSIFLVVILIVFSVILLLLLTCVAVFTKRCKEDDQELCPKLETENPNHHSSGKFDKTSHHSSLKKSTNNNNSNNNSHRTEIQMFTHKLPEGGMTSNSLFSDHSLRKLDDRCSVSDERNEYQLLGQSHEYRNLNLPPKYFNNYMCPNTESPTNHPLLIPGENVNTFLTMKPTVSTSFV